MSVYGGGEGGEGGGGRNLNYKLDACTNLILRCPFTCHAQASIVPLYYARLSHDQRFSEQLDLRDKKDFVGDFVFTDALPYLIAGRQFRENL